jgi:hypothetical protein
MTKIDKKMVIMLMYFDLQVSNLALYLLSLSNLLNSKKTEI